MLPMLAMGLAPSITRRSVRSTSGTGTDSASPYTCMQAKRRGFESCELGL